MRVAQGSDDGRVPRHLRRFSVDDWPNAVGTFAAHRRWRGARRSWAAANGFHVSAVHGTRPGRDWWAFLALCDEETPDGAA